MATNVLIKAARLCLELTFQRPLQTLLPPFDTLVSPGLAWYAFLLPPQLSKDSAILTTARGADVHHSQSRILYVTSPSSHSAVVILRSENTASAAGT